MSKRAGLLMPSNSASEADIAKLGVVNREETRRQFCNLPLPHKLEVVVCRRERFTVGRLPAEELAAADLTDELAAADLELAADGDRLHAARNRPALERAVIDVHLLGGGRDEAAGLRVEDHQVGIAARLDRAFTR